MQARLKGAIYPLSQYMVMWAEDRLKLFCVMGVRVGVANLFFNQSIGIDETKTFQFKYGR